MMKSLIFSPRATADIDQIYDYTEETWSSEQAEGYVFGIRAHCEALSEGARRGRKLDKIESGYSVLPFQSHFIVCKEGARSITIVRILHRRMNIGAHL